MRIQPELCLAEKFCDVNSFKIATSLIMTGIELPGQLAGVEGLAPLGGSGAAPSRGRGAAPPPQNAKIHSKLPVRSSGHSSARAENAEFQKFIRLQKCWMLYFPARAELSALERRSARVANLTLERRSRDSFL